MQYLPMPPMRLRESPLAFCGAFFAGTALLGATMGDELFLGASGMDLVRAAYCGALSTALAAPPVLLAAHLPGEKESGTAESLVLSPFPRRDLLWEIARQRLTAAFAGWLLPTLAATLGLWRCGFGDWWIAPAGPMGTFLAATGISLWAGVRFRSAAWAAAIAIVLTACIPLYFLLLITQGVTLITPLSTNELTMAVTAPCGFWGPVIGYLFARRAVANFDRGVLGEDA